MSQHMHITDAQLEHQFGYHKPPNAEVAATHGQVRETCLTAAKSLVELTGAPSPEQTLMVRKLEEAMFWANADIARKGALAHPPQP